MAPSWTHLVRFIAEEDGQVHLGQVDAKKWPDIGLATVNGQKVEAKLVKGSIFDGVVGGEDPAHCPGKSDLLFHQLQTAGLLQWDVCS